MDEMGDIIMFDGPATAERNFERETDGPNLIAMNRGAELRIRFVDGHEPGLKWVRSIAVPRPDKKLPTLEECRAHLTKRDTDICAIRDPANAPACTLNGGNRMFVLDIYRPTI